MNAEATAVRDTKPMGAAAPGRWSAPPSDAAVRAVVSLGRIPLRLLQTRTGRRLAATAVLSLLLVGAVSALYAHADGPATPPRPLNSAVPAAVARPAAGGKATSAAKTAGAARPRTHRARPWPGTPTGFGSRRTASRRSSSSESTGAPPRSW